MQAAYAISNSAHKNIHDTFYKGNKKLVPHVLLSYIRIWKCLRILERREKHSPGAHAFLAPLLHFFPACLYNSTMHSACFFFYFQEHSAAAVQ